MAANHTLSGINIVRLTNLGFFLLSGLFYSCTDKEIPVLTTTEVTGITTISAFSGGNITNDGGAEITSRGVCWNTQGNPTVADRRTLDGAGSGTFNSTVTQLAPDSYYALRSYATNSAGTGYGDEQRFVTPGITTGSVTDVDGNTYRTVVIGTQTWMAENLRTTSFNDNTSIPHVAGNAEWNSLITPGYCWYDNDASAYENTYGALYNWHTVAAGKLCPSGWHVPTDDQWSILATSLGGESAAGDKLKEEGGAHWIFPNAAANNSSGFTALPGGGRINGSFIYIGRSCAFWSATEYDADFAWCRELDDDKISLLRGNVDKSQGFSVRCIKN